MNLSANQPSFNPFPALFLFPDNRSRASSKESNKNVIIDHMRVTAELFNQWVLWKCDRSPAHLTANQPQEEVRRDVELCRHVSL